MDIEKIIEKVKEVIRKGTEHYLENDHKVAYVILATKYESTNTKGGYFILTRWFASDDIDLCWSPEEAGYGDLGTPLGSVSMEYFNLDHIANLIKIMYDSYVDDF